MPVYAIAVMAVGALIVSFQIYFPIPLLPLLAEQYDVTLSAAGWISGAFGFSYALGFLIFGPLSDSFGRKRMMVWGMPALVAATAALWQVTSFEGVIALRIVQGFAAATFAPTAIVYIAATVPEKLRPTALAVVGGSFLLSALLGQIFGSALGGSGDLSTIFALGALAYIAFGILLVLLPAEPRAPGGITPAQVYRALPGLLRNPLLVRGFIIGFTILGSFVGYYAAISIHLGDVVRNAGFDMIEVRYFGLPGLAFTFFSGPIIRRWTAARVARTGFIIAATGLIISGATSTLAIVLAGNVIFVAGIALCVPAMISYITALSPANNGLIIAVYSFNMFIGASLGPQLVVGLQSLGFFVTCLVFAAILLAMGAVIRAAPARNDSIESAAAD